MAISDNDFAQLVSLIEDGELDERMMSLQAAIDERNTRRKADILKLVKSVYGEEASIVSEHLPNPVSVPRDSEARAAFRGGGVGDPPIGMHAKRDPVQYEPEDPDEVPPGPAGWPDPIVSMGGGGGAGFSPVADPMGDGGDDGDVDTFSTGAQFR